MPRLLCCLLFAAAAGADELEDAIRAIWASGDISTFAPTLERIAEKGNIQAQVMLARAYEESPVVKRDYQRAMHWYRRASEKGSGEGSAGVAGLYEAGLGVPASEIEAKKWWEIAAMQGWDQQELTLTCLQLKGDPQSPKLNCEPPGGSGPCLEEESVRLLSEAGLRGTVTPSGGGRRFRRGPKARAFVVLRGPMATEARLRQPRHTTIAIIQEKDGWTYFPSSASLLDREILVGPSGSDPELIDYKVRDVDGSTTASGCAVWK